MSDYKKIYYKLFNAMTDAIQILQQAQQTTEELYISRLKNIPKKMKKTATKLDSRRCYICKFIF